MKVTSQGGWEDQELGLDIAVPRGEDKYITYPGRNAIKSEGHTTASELAFSPWRSSRFPVPSLSSASSVS
jgi:hypothetical protein